MNIYFFQFINYTLSFLMWMVLGRVVITLISGGKQNFIISTFQKITDPVYGAVKAVLPFAAVPQEKQGTMWWTIGGCIPFFSFFIILLLRLVLLIFFTPAPLVK